MDEGIRIFLETMDGELMKVAGKGEHLDLYHIGRSALILHHGLQLGTKDFDIVATHGSRLEEEAEKLFGKGTEWSKKLPFYLERVPPGLPPVPQHFRKRCQRVAGDWRIIRLWQPEPHDLAATKLTSFRAQDRHDLQFMCDAGLLQPKQLRKSLESAFLWSHEKDGDERRETAFANLHTVVDYLEGKTRSL